MHVFHLYVTERKEETLPPLTFTFRPVLPDLPFSPLSPGIPCCENRDDVTEKVVFIDGAVIIMLLTDFYTMGPIGPGGVCFPWGPALPWETQSISKALNMVFLIVN